MRPLDRSTYGVPAIVSSRLGTRLAERGHANDDPEARPTTFQVIAGDADHLAAGIQQRTAGVVTPSSLVDPRGGVGDRSILRSDEQRRLPWRSRSGRR
jgi:hypothetical protein